MFRRALLLALLLPALGFASDLADDGYERVRWGQSVEEVLATLRRDYNNPASLEVRKRQAIDALISEFKLANPGHPPPSSDEYDDTLDADDFRLSFEYEEVSSDELRPQYFLKELGTEIELDTGEGVIALTDERPQRFFCFAEGRLWKVVEIHEDAVVKEDLSFASFAQRLVRTLGTPDKKEHAAKPGSTRRELMIVQWKREKTDITAKPLFARYLVVYRSLETAAKIDKIREKMRKLKKREDSGDAP